MSVTAPREEPQDDSIAGAEWPVPRGLALAPPLTAPGEWSVTVDVLASGSNLVSAPLKLSHEWISGNHALYVLSLAHDDSRSPCAPGHAARSAGRWRRSPSPRNATRTRGTFFDHVRREQR